MLLVAAALATPPAAMDHPDVRGHFSGYVGVWGPEGPRTEAGARSADDVFFIGSLSKQFTAVAALTLVDDGQLRLDAPVASYFDDVPDDAWTLEGQVCTVERLLRATCGLRRTVWAPGDEVGHPDDPALARAYRQAIAATSLDFPPGADHAYSNAGYDLAGMLVSEVAGAPLATVLRDRVLGPLGLPDTGIGAAGLGKVEDRVQRGQLYIGGWWDAGTLTGLGPSYVASIGAAGGMWSTGHDLARFTRAVHGGELLSPGSYEAFTTPGPDGEYAMGVIRIERDLDDGPSEVIWHNGGLSPHGHSSFLAWLPDHDEVVVVLGHRDAGLAATDATTLGTRIRRERMGEDPLLDRLDTSLLDRFVLSFQMALFVLTPPLGLLALPVLGVVGPRAQGTVSFTGTLVMLAALVTVFGGLRFGSWAGALAFALLVASWGLARVRTPDAPSMVKGKSDLLSGAFTAGMGLVFLVVAPGGPLWGWVAVMLAVLLGTAQWSLGRGAPTDS